MMASGLPIEECVSTIAATLPVCSTRGVAYSTFTIIHLINNEYFIPTYAIIDELIKFNENNKTNRFIFTA